MAEGQAAGESGESTGPPYGPRRFGVRRLNGRPSRRGIFGAVAVLIVILMVALFAPQIVAITGAPGPNEIDPSSLSTSFGAPSGPSAAHWLGVDSLGRDVFSRVIYGARSSVVIGSVATVFAMVVGMLVGLLAGFRGGWLDAVLSRWIEVFLVIPYMLVAVGVATSCSGPEGCLGGTLRPGMPLVIAVIAIASWPWVARVTRNQTLVVKESNYVVQARVSGLGSGRTMTSEILPNLFELIPALVAVVLPKAILAEAALSFLGVGLPTTVPSWGRQIATGSTSFPETWWVMVFPGLILLATVFSIVTIGVWFGDRSKYGEGLL